MKFLQKGIVDLVMKIFKNLSLVIFIGMIAHSVRWLLGKMLIIRKPMKDFLSVDLKSNIYDIHVIHF